MAAAPYVSRSEAKLLLSRLEQFRDVELDFAGVDTVGQGFADEVFRVWPLVHPNTTITPDQHEPRRAVHGRQSARSAPQ